MGSINDWLAFSLSPHLTGVDMQGDNQSASNNSSGMVVTSTYPQHHPFQATYELPSNSTSSYYHSLRPEGSLCIIEALNRNHNEGMRMSMGNGMLHRQNQIKPEPETQSEQYINADLSILAGSNNNSDLTSESNIHGVTTSGHHHMSDERQRPKLEDFLGGASLGGGDETHHHNRNSELEDIYNNHHRGGASEDQLHLQGICMTESSDSSQHPELCNAANPNPDYHLFSECSLQLPQSSAYNMYGLSNFKTWLKSQSSSSDDSTHLNTTATAAAHNNHTNPSFPSNTTVTTVAEQNNSGSTKESLGLSNLGSIQPLTLSMSQSSESKSATAPPASQTSNGGDNQSLSSEKNDSQALVPAATLPLESTPRKSIDTFGQRTSIYRGVTKHRWTGRYEAHLWDNSCRREGQTRKGRQVYLGGYDKEEKAARAYDLAALKYWGPATTTNFPISNYEKELEEMKHMTRQEYVASLRRKSSGFSRGASIYRGVTRHHQHGRWQARIGRVAGNKDLYLGTFSTQEEAAEAYDIAAIKFRGLNAVTNFDISRYDVKSIANSTLPIGGIAKRLKEAEPAVKRIIEGHDTEHESCSSREWPTLLTFANPLAAAAPPRVNATAASWVKQQQQQQHQQDADLHKYLQPFMPTSGGSCDMYSTGNSSLMLGNSSERYVDETDSSVASKAAYESYLTADNFARNMYYLSQQQQHAVNKSMEYENNLGYNNWMTTNPMQNMMATPRPNLAVCHAPIFSVWGDS